jgi:hypothetical protein
MRNFNKLKILPVDKTVVFYTPFEGDDCFVRTGTIAEGSCFFHSLLHACSSEYTSMDRKDRMKFVRRLRASMAGKIDRNSWEEMGNGLISKVPYQENFNKILTNFANFLNQKNDSNKVRGRATRRTIKHFIKNEQDYELFNVLNELVPTSTAFEKVILPKAYENSSNKKINKCAKSIIKETLTYLDSLDEFKAISEKQQDYLATKMVDLITYISKEAENEAFENYVKSLENNREDIDSSTLELISDRFNRDIYFLDGSTRLPYNYCPSSNNIKGRRSIIIMWIDKTHYEIVGRLLPGNRIQREFSADDPMIKKFNEFLFNHEAFKLKYPDLACYYKTKDDQEEDLVSEVSAARSDPYYDSSDHDSQNYDYDNNSQQYSENNSQNGYD